MDDDIDRGSPGTGPPPEPGGSGVDPELAERAEAEAIVEATEEAVVVDAEPDAPGDIMDALRPVRQAAAAAIGAPERPRRGPSSAVLAATLFLIGSTILSVSFMLTRGGLALPVASPEPSEVAVASPTAGPTGAPTPIPGASTTPGATATPRPTPRPTPSPTPDPRLALLEPCPDTPDCYLYTVQTNDRLAKIAVRFGVPFDTILELNPWITDPNVIHPGDEITLPPPGP